MRFLKANRTSLTKLFFVAFGCSILAMPAVAADLPVKAPTPAPVATVYSWAGPYVGVNAGVVWGRSDQTSAPSAALADPAQIPVTLSVLLPRLQGTRNFDPAFIGGGQIGYNWQLTQWVFGLEADFNYVGLDKTFEFFAPTSSSGTSVTVVQSTSLDWLATFRGRLGFAINNVLLYGTGGLAVGKVNFNSAIGMIFSGGDSSGFLNVSASDTRVGWAAGAGAEYGLGRWSFRIEYLHVDLGSFTATAPFTGPFAVLPPPCINCFLNTNIDFKADTVRAAVNYRF
jgi:outer membrane immunogenic protein